MIKYCFLLPQKLGVEIMDPIAGNVPRFYFNVRKDIFTISETESVFRGFLWVFDYLKS